MIVIFGVACFLAGALATACAWYESAARSGARYETEKLEIDRQREALLGEMVSYVDEREKVTEAHNHLSYLIERAEAERNSIAEQRQALDKRVTEFEGLERERKRQIEDMASQLKGARGRARRLAKNKD